MACWVRHASKGETVVSRGEGHYHLIIDSFDPDVWTSVREDRRFSVLDRFRNRRTDLFCIKRDFIGPK